MGMERGVRGCVWLPTCRKVSSEAALRNPNAGIGDHALMLQQILGATEVLFFMTFAVLDSCCRGSCFALSISRKPSLWGTIGSNRT